jgi:hypothetical protein
MAAMSQAKKFRKESELLQMLENSTDSELSSGLLFHSDKITVIVILKILAIILK